jgi:enoyl-CoA hydratase
MAVRIEDDGAVRVVTIDRPEQRNALDPETMAGIGAAFVEAEDDDAVRVIVLTGAGNRAFCAGMDLKAFAAQGPMSSTSVGTEVFVERVYPKPIIAAVNGACVAGGLGIALGCDILVAADHATFGLPEVRRGLVGVGAGTRAAQRLPPAIALEMILSGEPFDAARAFTLGLVNRVVPLAELMPTAMTIARQIAANAPLAVRFSKQMVYDVGRLFDVDIPALRAAASSVMRSDDAREGARAFAEKRPPEWKGR